MVKKYENEKINEIIEYSFEVAFKDEEWEKGLRNIEE